MTSREFKDLSFQHFALIANSFAHPKRLEIIDILSQGSRDVDKLSKETNMSFANTSRHLQILKNAKLVTTRKEGVRIIYSLVNEDVIKCWKNLQSLTEKIVIEIREAAKLFFEERATLNPMPASELWEKLKNNEITLIDVRPREEYLNGHIPNAISLPLKELKEKIDELPHNKEIVAYCRGPYCVLAADAVKLLREKGFTVTLSKDDVNSWRYAGHQIER